MLSPQTIHIVKSTAPILNEHGEALTRHFYQRMFLHNPEVMPLFNPANQSGGTQQRALAAAICAYAANIDNLDVLGNAVELIAQKHASLMIRPEHYPVVGANLLASIREVLGAGATEEIIDAWAQAYGFLADILMGREKQIYQDNAAQKGGWTGFRAFTVTRKERESANITSFYLTPADGGDLPDFMAGQYITLRMPTPDGATTMRNYSLSDRPGRDYFRISVKRETGAQAQTPDGYVSNKLHDDTVVGDRLEIGPPCGEFYLDVEGASSRPLVLLAAGVGITPIMSILHTALETMPERKIVLIHACLNREVQAFASGLSALAARHENLQVHFRYSEPVAGDAAGMGETGGADARHSYGFIDEALMERFLPSRAADYYFCGPKPFMMDVYHMLLAWGIPANQTHFEFFGPRQELEKRAA